MKQTAVEWLVTRIAHGGLVGKKQFDELVEQAKAMEKQEKIDFADKYGTYLLQGGIMSAAAYNETFKSE